MAARVVIVAYPELQSLDVAGPAEVFAAAPGYEVLVVAPTREPLLTGSGFAIVPAATLEEVIGDGLAIDTLVVSGGAGSRAATADDGLLDQIRVLAARADRVASVCTGAFLLARAGLLDGRRCTTHWAWCEALARAFPALDVDSEPIFVRDGDVWTSAGVTAGMDLALALVADDHGPAAALEVARRLVLFVRRPGGQAQFSAGLAGQQVRRDGLRELVAWLQDHLDADLSVPALARRAHMSERHFARAFVAECGTTPAAYVERVRVERARLLLETTDAGVESIARSAGFGSVETLRRAFARTLGVSPADYRSRFAA
ncbi:GlxA family transcriptional regulator [Paraconexibacter sp.]|uniref:GlxA family transcriptional regulator n=1 Tax=Paraconexibacter sp. TaxID=2949640 RepID=UPI003566ECC7